jgi:ABC-type multidrug transport system ATPase subunit/pSer/pThr/pTyr-binding forkhead associated (FHA) protein
MTKVSAPSFKIFHQEKLIKEFSINEDSTLTIGRSPSCSINIDHPRISRQHAQILVKNHKVYIIDNDSANKTFLEDIALSPHTEYPINTNTTIRLGTGEYSIHVVIAPDIEPPSFKKHQGPKSNIIELLKNKNGKIKIGRSSDCDIYLPSLRVSRNHATIEQEHSKIYITDHQSKNGTFINGIRIKGKIELQLNDVITISSYELSLNRQGVTDIRDHGFAIVAEKISKTFPNGNVGLEEMSIKIPAKSFVALMGPSGCGKSTLMKGLNGANPVTKGAVSINGLPLNKKNFDLLRRNIGYVPQDDIVHKSLTVEKTLYYAAKLRMAEDVSDNEIALKIDEVLDSLNINTSNIRNTRVEALSGGQRKRISIAVELLHSPTILFLDEPTSPLDPETIGDFLECIRQLTDQGVTTVMVTHKPSDLVYVDQVLFLSAGGFMTYFGDKDDLLPHFECDNIIDIYALLKYKEEGKVWNKTWAKKHPQSTIPPSEPESVKPENESFLRQLYWLSRRYLDIKLSDKQNMLLMFFQPVIIALLICFIFNTGLEIGVLFLIIISAIWFGVSNAAKEIVNEIPIYERERMFNMNIFSYLFSKIIILSIISLIQVLTFMGIIFVAYTHFNIPENYPEVFPKSFIHSSTFVFYISISATLFGLVLSAIFKTVEKVMTVVPIALIPQIMLAGVVAQIDNTFKDLISYFTLGRWGTEGLGYIQDHYTQEYINAQDSTDLYIRSDSTEVLYSILSPDPIFKDSMIACLPVDSLSITIPTGDTEYRPDEALRVLSFHGENTLGLLTDSALSPTLAITVLNIACILVIYFMLKGRDKIR